MGRILGVGLLLSGLCALFFAFNNCSEVNFTQLPSVPNESPLAQPVTVDEIITGCESAQKAGKLLTQTSLIVFEDTGIESGRPKNVCEFGQGDNLAAKNGVLTAQYVQTQDFVLPAGSVLCDLDMKTSKQSFKYDDMFFFTMNGYLLASNMKSAVETGLVPMPAELPRSKEIVGVYPFNWLGVRGKAFQNNVRDDYCLGFQNKQSMCQWPLTEQAGDILFDFSPELLITLSAGRSDPSQQFGFVITGDNDPASDCYHERLEFEMIGQYFIPNK